MYWFPSVFQMNEKQRCRRKNSSENVWRYIIRMLQV